MSEKIIHNDWQGIPIEGDEPDDKVINVWVISPSQDASYDETWIRDYHKALEYAGQSLELAVDTLQEDELLEHGVILKMKLRKTTVGEIKDMNDSAR